VLIEEFGNILFEDARDEEESLAEIPVATAGAALPATTSPALPGPPRSEPKPREQRREESEYLEDFEIIGGSGKRKQ
jgi:hypothetical protein